MQNEKRELEKRHLQTTDAINALYQSRMLRLEPNPRLQNAQRMPDKKGWFPPVKESIFRQLGKEPFDGNSLFTGNFRESAYNKMAERRTTKDEYISEAQRLHNEGKISANHLQQIIKRANAIPFSRKEKVRPELIELRKKIIERSKKYKKKKSKR